MTDNEKKIETFDEFKEVVTTWLDLNNQYIEALRGAYDDLSDKYERVLGAMDAINTKVDLIAYDQGIIKERPMPSKCQGEGDLQ